MSNYQKDNRGALFSNKKREKDTHPTHTGSATIAGVDYWVSAWVKEKDGERYFSMSYKEKEQRQDVKQASYKAQEPAGFDDTDVPFTYVMNCHAI